MPDAQPVVTDAVFRPEVAEFFAGLEANNRKDWFDAHREEWRTLVQRPLEDLLAEAEARYGPGRVMRITRDVRFSADRSPYNTSGSMWAGSVGGVYLRVSADGLEVGGGLYGPSRDQLTRGRAAIDSGAGAAAGLRAVLGDLRARGYETAGPSLTTAPRGFPKDHPDIDLLRLKHYAALRALPLEADRREVVDGWAAVEPLIAWVAAWVGPAERWP